MLKCITTSYSLPTLSGEVRVASRGPKILDLGDGENRANYLVPVMNGLLARLEE